MASSSKRAEAFFPRVYITGTGLLVLDTRVTCWFGSVLLLSHKLLDLRLTTLFLVGGKTGVNLKGCVLLLVVTEAAPSVDCTRVDGV